VPAKRFTVFIKDHWFMADTHLDHSPFALEQVWVISAAE
jgi:hypothetical protein